MTDYNNTGHSSCKENDIIICMTNMNIRQCSHAHPIIYFVPRFNIIKNYITGNNMLTIVIYISQHLISSTFVSDVYGLM